MENKEFKEYEMRDELYTKIKARAITEKDVNKGIHGKRFITFSINSYLLYNTPFASLSNKCLDKPIDGEMMLCEVVGLKTKDRYFVLPLPIFNEHFVCVSPTPLQQQMEDYIKKSLENNNILQGSYEKEIDQFKVYPKEKEAEYLTLGLVGEAGEIANLMKKVIRNNNGIITEQQAAHLKDELGDVLWYLAALANASGYSLNEIAKHNLEKLHNRKSLDNLKHE